LLAATLTRLGTHAADAGVKTISPAEVRRVDFEPSSVRRAGSGVRPIPKASWRTSKGSQAPLEI
jgi:hypothetical protein